MSCKNNNNFHFSFKKKETKKYFLKHINYIFKDFTLFLLDKMDILAGDIFYNILAKRIKNECAKRIHRLPLEY